MRFKTRLQRSVGVAFLAFCTAFLTLGTELSAQGLKLQTSVDRNRVEVGETVALTVSVSAERLGSIPEPEVIVSQGISGDFVSSFQMKMNVNGVVVETEQFTFSLRAEREGSHTLGPARVTYQGKTYESNTIRIEVVKRTAKPQTRPAPRSAQQFGRSGQREINSEDLFIMATPDKRVVYVGEQVNVSYKLYTRYRLGQVSIEQEATYTGFWAVTLHDARRLDLKRETFNDREFDALLLKEVALFPTGSGKHALGQLRVLCEVRMPFRKRSLFDEIDIFVNQHRSQRVRVPSDDLELEVRPLPPGSPSGFAGAVGQFQISAEATPTAVTAGDPIALKVTVSGTGNLNAVPEPVRPSGGAFRFYDPKVSLETQKQGGRLGGRKTFEYVVIPQEAGTRQIPPLRLVYFDPERERFAAVETRPIGLVVTPGIQTERPDPVPILSREEVRVLGEDIRYIKPDQTHLTHQGGALYRDWRFLALQGAPVLGFLGVFAYKRHRERLMGDVAYARRRRSRSEARRRLSEARRLMRAGEGGPFHTEITRALAQFLADRLNRPAAGMTADSAAGALQERGAPPEVIDRTLAVFRQCDFARFAPAQGSAGGMETLYKDVEGLIEELGRSV